MDGVPKGSLPSSTVLAVGRSSYLPLVRRAAGVGGFGADHTVDPSMLRSLA